LIGIYKIECLVNGKLYIGQSKNIEGRFRQHTGKLNRRKHFNSYLQRAWNKYGEGSFTFSIVEETTIIDISEREIYWIKFLRSHVREDGYNLTTGGEGTSGVLEFTKERKSMLSRINKGNSNAKGYKHSEQALATMRQKKLGTKPRLGCSPSSYTRQKIREFNLGKVLPLETRERMSKAKSGANAYQASFTEIQVIEIRRLIGIGNKVVAIAKLFNVPPSTIYKIRARTTYQNVI